MDKPEEEIQRYQDYETSGCFPLADGDYVKYEDHAKALSAERERAEKRVESNRLYGYRDGMKESEEKIEALESKLKEAEKKIVAYENLAKTHTEMLDANSECFSKASEKITALEAKVKELDDLNTGLNASNNFLYDQEQQYRRKFEAANAMIVELAATQLSLDDICYRKLNSELEAELSTANKKAEKLVDALERLCPFLNNPQWGNWGYMEGSNVYTDIRNAKETVEQAIKEFRGN